MSNLIPTQIVDKNGKSTTVHKKADDGASSARLGAVPPPRIEETGSKATSGVRMEFGDVHVVQLNEGETIKMKCSANLSHELTKDEYPSEEARAFRLIHDNGVTGELTYVGFVGEGEDKDWETAHNKYAIRLHNDENGQDIELDYHSGIGVQLAPDLIEVVGTLIADTALMREYADFSDWADNLGYEIHEIGSPERSQARRIYAESMQQSRDFEKFVGDEELLSDALYG